MLVDFPANRGLFSRVIPWRRQEEKRSLPTVATLFDLKRRPRSWISQGYYIIIIIIIIIIIMVNKLQKVAPIFFKF